MKMADKCPMCGLSKKHLKPDPDSSTKSMCGGCGSKFFDKDRFFKE